MPIIIHLLNRRRFKTVSWAAMEFLLRAMRKNRRRLRFEQLLLLATRCLLVLLLGMALARPLGCENSALAKLGRRTSLNVYVIDTSYSMAYEVNQAERQDASRSSEEAGEEAPEPPVVRRRVGSHHHGRQARDGGRRQAAV